MRYKKLSIVGLGTIVASFAVLALIWRSSASYLSLIPVFFVGTGMAGLFTTQFVALSARSRGGHARTTITAYYLAQQLGLIIGVTTSATIVRTLFANDLRRSLHGVSQIDEVIIGESLEAMVFGILTLCYSLFKEFSTTIASQSHYPKQFNRMFDKASNTAFEPYPVRITTETLVPELMVESSSLPVHHFSGSTDYRTPPTIFDFMSTLEDTRGIE